MFLDSDLFYDLSASREGWMVGQIKDDLEGNWKEKVIAKSR
jgi:hypothetical protein